MISHSKKLQGVWFCLGKFDHFCQFPIRCIDEKMVLTTNGVCVAFLFKRFEQATLVQVVCCSIQICYIYTYNIYYTLYSCIYVFVWGRMALSNPLTKLNRWESSTIFHFQTDAVIVSFKWQYFFHFYCLIYLRTISIFNNVSRCV